MNGQICMILCKGSKRRRFDDCKIIRRRAQLRKNMKKDTVNCLTSKVIWYSPKIMMLSGSANCGHICVGKKAPEVCPVCNHPQAYFQQKAENY